jgi:transposase-like protein
MQILHPFTGSVQHYLGATFDQHQHRPTHCPQCAAKHPLKAHGFYTRTIIDTAFEGLIRIRRYLCAACRRTVSLLPGFALPYLRSTVTVIALFLVARLLHNQALKAALPSETPYQRGQFWLRRFRLQAESLCASLAAIIKPAPAPAPNFIHRALHMLQTSGWIPAHRFLFTNLRQHMLGWPPSLAPTGQRLTLASIASSG